MNYIQPTQNAFIVPRGTKLKRTKESIEVKAQRKSLKSCLNSKNSKNGKRVYNVEIDDE